MTCAGESDLPRPAPLILRPTCQGKLAPPKPGSQLPDYPSVQLVTSCGRRNNKSSCVDAVSLATGSGRQESRDKAPCSDTQAMRKASDHATSCSRLTS